MRAGAVMVTLTLVCAQGAAAAPALQFDSAVTVGGEPAAGVYPHLESAGRRSIAADGEAVAVVWEDNRTGSPQVYASVGRGEAFSAPQRLSRGAEAYEPAVVALGAGRFAAAWEGDGKVRLQLFDADGPQGGYEVEGGRDARQPTLAPAPQGGFYAAWARAEGRFTRIVAARFEPRAEGVAVRWMREVDAGELTQAQLYPAVAASAAGVTVGWEDRRHGHTRLYTAFSEDGAPFSAPQLLNELPPSRNVQFGRGSGVTRLSLAAGDGRVAAAWMDKRDFEGGYDIYAAFSGEGRRFGDNELVQDMFGENQPQWHPSIAHGPDGTVAVAWDDPRDGTPDVWFSIRRDGQWSDDFTFADASGPGAQRSPSITFDAQGRLHAVWVERPESGPARVRYSVGTAP